MRLHALLRDQTCRTVASAQAGFCAQREWNQPLEGVRCKTKICVCRRPRPKHPCPWLVIITVMLIAGAISKANQRRCKGYGMTAQKYKLPIFLPCFGFICCLLAAGIGWFAWKAASPPVYKVEQVDSEHEGYRQTTLTHADTVYVNDYEESALVAFGEGTRQKIGNLPLGGFSASGIFSIPGQSPSAYVLEFDPMYEIVYRNIQHPPFDWRTANFQMMRLTFPARNAKETNDQKVIQDVIASLIGNELILVPFQADGNYAGYQNYGLMSFSQELPGLGYIFGVHVAQDGAVYVAVNSSENHWFPAGSIFTEWVNSP